MTETDIELAHSTQGTSVSSHLIPWTLGTVSGWPKCPDKRGVLKSACVYKGFYCEHRKLEVQLSATTCTNVCLSKGVSLVHMMCEGILVFREQYCIAMVNCVVFHSFLLSMRGHLAGMVLGFNVVLPKSFETFARHREVEVLTNRVIYRLLQQLKVSLLACVCSGCIHACNICCAWSVMRYLALCY